MRKLKLLGVLLAMMAVVASSTVAPAMANHWDDDDDHRDRRDDNCFLGYREEDRLVQQETIFGTWEWEVITVKVPCDDDDDRWDDDDDHHWRD